MIISVSSLQQLCTVAPSEAKTGRDGKYRICRLFDDMVSIAEGCLTWNVRMSVY